MMKTKQIDDLKRQIADESLKFIKETIYKDDETYQKITNVRIGEDIYKILKERVDSWHPNPSEEYKTIYGKPIEISSGLPKKISLDTDIKYKFEEKGFYNQFQKLELLNADEKLQDFLHELTDLTNKYGFEIGGCGCCGSPYITKKARFGHDDVAEDLKYVDGEYIVGSIYK